MVARRRTPVAGPVAVEGEPTGDGRMQTVGSFRWDGVLPIPIVFDAEDGDHSGATLGAIESLSRRPFEDTAVIWGEGYLEDSEVPEFQALVDRARELLEQGAVGVSLRYDDESVEVRVRRDLIEVAAVEEASVDPPDLETTDDDGEERIVVARFSADDVLYVTTDCRVRHLAIVDTAAMVFPEGNRFGVAASGRLEPASGAIAAAANFEEWAQYSWMFDDPKFGDITSDPRLRYDPERGLWSCPPTVERHGDVYHYYGHVTPAGICLRGRPDKCVNPPDGDLEGFMRGRAPAAGGRRTGVVTLADRGQHGHCRVGIGVLEATQFYDGGHGAADVRVGRDQYGIWFSGMTRPGLTEAEAYQLAASDVSGHWEYPLMGVRNRATLVGLPAVDVGGFPKGYLTYQEFVGGLAASASLVVGEGCSPWTQEETSEATTLEAIATKLDQIGAAVGELWAAHINANVQ